MDVYMAMARAGGKGPMFHAVEEALMVFLDPADTLAAAEAQGEDASVVKIASGRVAERLRETGHDRVIVVLGADEMYGCSVDDFERLLADLDADMEKERERINREQAYRAIGEMLEDGRLEYDFETDKVRATGK